MSPETFHTAMRVVGIIFLIIFSYLFFKNIYIFIKSRNRRNKEKLYNESVYIKQALSSKNQCSDFKKFTKQLGRDNIDYTVLEKVGDSGRTEVAYRKRFAQDKVVTDFIVQFTYTGKHVGLLVH